MKTRLSLSIVALLLAAPLQAAPISPYGISTSSAADQGATLTQVQSSNPVSAYALDSTQIKISGAQISLANNSAANQVQVLTPGAQSGGVVLTQAMHVPSNAGAPMGGGMGDMTLVAPAAAPGDNNVVITPEPGMLLLLAGGLIGLGLARRRR